MTTAQESILREWCEDASILLHAHFDEGARCERQNLKLGVPALILSAVVGTSIFAALGKEPSLAAKVAVGCISMAVTIMTSLQTFLRFSERAEKHRVAGAMFASLRKEIEQTLVYPPKSDDELGKWMTSIRDRWDSLRREKPALSESILSKHKLLVRSEHVPKIPSRSA